MATQRLMLQIFGVDSSPDNICFVGVIDGDNRSEINKVLQKAAKAVENRIKKFSDAYKIVQLMDSMSPEEIFVKFFSDQREIVKNSYEEVPKKVYRRVVPMRQAKLKIADPTVDLPADEDDKVSQASLTSSCFWEACGSSGVSNSESCSGEKARKLLIQKPADPQMLDDFIKAADESFVVDPSNYQTETRSLKLLEKEFATLAAKMYQRQEDEEIEKEKRWQDDYSNQGTKKNTKREKNCLPQASSSSAVQKNSKVSNIQLYPDSSALKNYKIPKLSVEKERAMQRILLNIKNISNSPLSGEHDERKKTPASISTFIGENGNNEAAEIANVENVVPNNIRINSKGVRMRKLYNP